MNRPVRYAVRFLLLSAFLIVAVISVAPAPPSADSPYVSALSDLVATEALAKPCPNKQCQFSSGRKPQCVNSQNRTFCQGPISTCQTVAC